jgi:hypothetical protein
MAVSGVGCRTSSPGCWTGDWGACYQSVAVLDLKWYSQFNALLNMLRTLFICAILAVGVFVFNRDASKLVLQPIERMLKKVKDVSENPLAIKQVQVSCIFEDCMPDIGRRTLCTCSKRMMGTSAGFTQWALVTF